MIIFSPVFVSLCLLDGILLNDGFLPCSTAFSLVFMAHLYCLIHNTVPGIMVVVRLTYIVFSSVLCLLFRAQLYCHLHFSTALCRVSFQWSLFQCCKTEVWFTKIVSFNVSVRLNVGIDGSLQLSPLVSVELNAVTDGALLLSPPSVQRVVTHTATEHSLTDGALLLSPPAVQ